MTSHDVFTSGTSRIIIVESLQRLKFETLILAPADWEVRPVIKLLNAQSIAPIEILHALLVFGGNPFSNPGSDQTDWGSFRGFPQSSRKILCWIYIITIHLTVCCLMVLTSTKKLLKYI